MENQTPQKNPINWKLVLNRGIIICTIIFGVFLLMHLVQASKLESDLEAFQLSQKEELAADKLSEATTKVRCQKERLLSTSRLDANERGEISLTSAQVICYQNKLQVLNCTDRVDADMNCSQLFPEPAK